jgi:hypothetical protein
MRELRINQHNTGSIRRTAIGIPDQDNTSWETGASVRLDI